MMDKARTPHLIDFSWANRHGHLLKDFVLMENSLRFMLFPRYLSVEDQLKCDLALLKEDGCRSVAAISFSSSEARRAFRRLAHAVQVIRTAARNCAYEGFDLYLAAQFLVLYGLLAYDSYNFLVALRALGLIGAKVIAAEYAPQM
jgi:hypothetical protein